MPEEAGDAADLAADLPAVLDRWVVAGTRRWIEAHQSRCGESAAAVHPFAGGFAFHAGVDSPLSKVVGCRSVVAAEELSALARFYDQRGGGYDIELSALADRELRDQLEAAGYRRGVTEVALVRKNEASRATALPLPEGIDAIERLLPSEGERAAQVLAAAAFAPDPPSAALLEVARTSLSQSDSVGWVAVAGGVDVACACHSIADENGVASLYGGATLPEWRGRGIQRALIEVRCADLRRSGARWVVVVTAAETTSFRNAERAGFRASHAWELWRRASGIVADDGEEPGASSL